jgi:hypothetical protein
MHVECMEVVLTQKQAYHEKGNHYLVRGDGSGSGRMLPTRGNWWRPEQDEWRIAQ